MWVGVRWLLSELNLLDPRALRAPTAKRQPPPYLGGRRFERKRFASQRRAGAKSREQSVNSDMGCSGSKPAEPVGAQAVDIKVLDSPPPAADAKEVKAAPPAPTVAAPAPVQDEVSQTVSKALKQLAGHRADAKVCSQTFETIAPLCVGAEGTKLAITHGVVPFALKSLTAHTADADTQRWGCTMLSNIFDADGTTAADGLGARQREQAVEVAKSAMRSHTADSQVQSAALGLLTALAKSPDELAQLQLDAALSPAVDAPPAPAAAHVDKKIVILFGPPGAANGAHAPRRRSPEPEPQALPLPLPSPRCGQGLPSPTHRRGARNSSAVDWRHAARGGGGGHGGGGSGQGRDGCGRARFGRAGRFDY